MTKLIPGIYRWPAEAYHRDPAPEPSLSSTLAKLIIGKSPAHAWTASPRLNPDWQPEIKETFDIGTAAHSEVLGVGAGMVAYPLDVLASNGAASTKEAKAWAEEQRAAGRVPLKADVVDAVSVMADAVRSRLAVMKITLDPSRSEMVALAQRDGIWCRALIDNAPIDPRQPLYDLKTCTDASVDACIRQIVNYGYAIQAAHYLETWKAATGEDRRFRFVFVEKAPPHEVAVIELYDKPGDEADWMGVALAQTAEARRIWRQCLDSGSWPGYPAQIAVVGAPAWYAPKWDALAAAPQPSAPTPETLARASQWQAPMEVAQ